MCGDLWKVEQMAQDILQEMCGHRPLEKSEQIGQYFYELF